MDDIKNMVAWKYEYNRMVTKKLVVGPRLHIKMPVEKTKTEEPSKEDQIKLQQAKEDIKFLSPIPNIYPSTQFDAQDLINIFLITNYLSVCATLQMLLHRFA